MAEESRVCLKTIENIQLVIFQVHNDISQQVLELKKMKGLA